ncbi:tRNA (N6-isopentenyl adenosine(37)-C2)-methylthiotransferase MiaB [candidate division KSB1 bacterium]|nr:MAG: tRNA (N6-isopentenyl adenosine(37)-C2)-methylthiotransferase MiaB [candidate division KSB1 bacterium]
MKAFIKTYGCQMNKYDSEIIAGILKENGFKLTEKTNDADIILVNTCSVREHAEKRMLGYLTVISNLKKENPDLIIGVVGCAALRLNKKILKKIPGVNFVLGPDKYKLLPGLLTDLSCFDETCYTVNNKEKYEDIIPVRNNGISEWVAIMRGCNNFCSYCVVPYVRGRERSRSVKSIITEIKELVAQGIKEVTLLGQNVNSYNDGSFDFPDLLRRVSEIDGLKRIRFATSHPKDLSTKLLEVIKERKNICNHIHLPVQSGSGKILKKMNRKYTPEEYISLVEKAKSMIEGISITTDIITGFPGETEEDHQATMELIRKLEFDSSFVFRYSPREGTKAFHYKDDVPENVKIRRLEEINSLQQSISEKINKKLIGKTCEVLIEGTSRRSKKEMKGKLDSGKGVVIKENDKKVKAGDIIKVRIFDANSKTLFGKINGRKNVDI